MRRHDVCSDTSSGCHLLGAGKDGTLAVDKPFFCTKYLSSVLTLINVLWYTIHLFDRGLRLCYNYTELRRREGDRLATTRNTSSLEDIRRNLEAHVGKKVHLKANRGRRKVIEAEGVLENTYPKVFVVRLDKKSPVRRMSYTYADVLTETVELTIDDQQVGVAGS